LPSSNDKVGQAGAPRPVGKTINDSESIWPIFQGETGDNVHEENRNVRAAATSKHPLLML